MTKTKKITYLVLVITVSLIAGGISINVGGNSIGAALFCVMSVLVYGAIGIVDYEIHIIPNILLILLTAIKIPWLLFYGNEFIMEDCFVGFATMMLICISLYFLDYFVTKSELVGIGDYKYLIVVGFCLGFEKMMIAMVVSLAGVILYMCYCKIVSGKNNLFLKIAVAPFISFGAVCANCIR